MKLHLLDRSSSKNSSFNAKCNRYPFFLKTWHYHPELELVVVLKSSGTRFIGDSIQKFEEGEVVLIGENLPHMWSNDKKYFEKSSNLIAEAIAIHFKNNFLGSDFFENPEMRHILDLFERAKFGIKFLAVKKEIIDDIGDIVELDGFEKTMKFIRVLNALAKHSHFELLSSEGFANSFTGSDNKNLYTVYEYIFKNFNQPIYLKDVASIANLNPSSFSRFFKRVNRKTYSRYLNEIRIGFACKLLMENKYNITTICYESGFNNISNFNRQFKSIKKMSPSEYLQQYSKN